MNTIDKRVKDAALCAILFFALSDAGIVRAGEQPTDHRQFTSMWYQGKAELTSYSLEQARYGEIHRGHAVLIYVTEDFSRRKQVKLDTPQKVPKDRIYVMKLNFTSKFNTGIYPYSMMMSVFTPVEQGYQERPLKITTTSQEWCGHTFFQMNRTKRGYTIQQFSYFERDGDKGGTLRDTLTEDGLWVTLRLDPGRLPTGEISLIPGTLFLRLNHIQWKPRKATATLAPMDKDARFMTYTLTYPDLDRSLSIHYTKNFPYEIEGWEERTLSQKRNSDRQLITRGTRMKRVWLDYWNKNRPADTPLRQELGLDAGR